MMTTPQILSVTPKKDPSFGITTADGLMLLQRRGITNTREYGNTTHHFYVIEDGWRAIVTFSESDKKPNRAVKFHGEHYLHDAQAIIQEIGADLRFAHSTLAYCYASLGGGEIEKDDVFLSPLRYEVGSDTIRHVPTNYCVVAFEDGQFSKPIFDVDRAASGLQPAVTKALQRGFHSCNLRLGDDHCKRRLAWLAGAYLMDQHTDAQIAAEVLARDMSTRSRIH